MRKSRWTRSRAVLIWLCGAVLPTAFAQQQDDQVNPEDVRLPPLRASRSGLRLLGASVFATWYSNGMPEGRISPGVALASDVALGGQAAIGYSRSAPRTTWSFSYSGSYSGRLRYRPSDAASHVVDARFRHSFSPRLMFDAGIDASMLNLEELQFTPTALGAVTSTNSSFDELANAVTRGVSANAGLDALLTGPQNVDALDNILYRTRTVNSSLRVGVTRLHSEKTTWRLAAVGSRTQAADYRSGPVGLGLPQSSSAGLLFHISRTMTRRVQVHASVASTRLFSLANNSDTHSALIGASRMIARSWFFSADGGAGVIRARGNAGLIPTGPEYVGNGVTGFTTHEHTFTASYSRSLGESHAYGAFATRSTEGAWRWSRPGRSWTASASVRRQVLGGGRFPGTVGWYCMADFEKTIRRGVAWRLEYAYIYYTTPGLAPGLSTFSQGLVRSTIRWGAV